MPQTEYTTLMETLTQKRNNWTPQQEEWLRTNQQVMDLVDLYHDHNKMFGFYRSLKSISRKREVKKLRKFKEWTPPMGTFITDNYMTLSDKDMASQLRIPTKTVTEFRSMNKLSRRHYLSDAEKLLRKEKRLSKQRIQARNTTAALQTYKQEKGCCICGETNPVVLDFHHIDPTKKSFNIATARVYNEQVQSEIDKCVVICSNHHRLLHAGQLVI